eukprot:gnl/Chilomastix_cuspidata/6900.p3 GENE.gnl/Chilomastix_cuspidata/6900~~gnl/Chilomastix_cuspidata/6900.p3  ORF type:complete len:105 (-),score=9.50 gnl/Chilomastix_cuspidata/6900:1472-1786(-)
MAPRLEAPACAEAKDKSATTRTRRVTLKAATGSNTGVREAASLFGPGSMPLGKFTSLPGDDTTDATVIGRAGLADARAWVEAARPALSAALAAWLPDAADAADA